MYRSSSLRSVVLAASATSLLVGCPSGVDRRAQDGLDALARCDLRAAHAAFDEAWEMDESRSDIALAYALTDLATLVEDPALTALAPRFGFDREIDSSLLWGRDGLLDRLAREDSCESIDDWMRAEFPHPAVRGERESFWDTLDSELTLGEVRDALVAISPRLERVARALRLAADHVEDGGVTIEGGCGLATTPTRLQRPELLALAAGLEAVRAATRLAQGYDGALTVEHVLLGADPSARQAWVDAMRAHFLRPTDPAAIASSRATFDEAARLAHEAVAAAREVRGAPRVSDAIFDWTRIPAVVLDDVDAFALAVREGLADGAGSVRIPRISPELGLDLASFFDEPFDGTSEGPIWSVERDGEYEWIATDSAMIESLLAARFSSDPWAESAPRYEWTTDWTTFDSQTWLAVFDPGERWSDSYDCAN